MDIKPNKEVQRKYSDMSNFSLYIFSSSSSCCSFASCSSSSSFQLLTTVHNSFLISFIYFFLEMFAVNRCLPMLLLVSLDHLVLFWLFHQEHTSLFQIEMYYQILQKQLKQPLQQHWNLSWTFHPRAHNTERLTPDFNKNRPAGSSIPFQPKLKSQNSRSYQDISYGIKMDMNPNK